MKTFKIIALLAVVIFTSSCKKESEDILKGKWELEKLYIDGYEPSKRYGDLDTCVLDSTTANVVSYNKIEHQTFYWEFSGVGFSGTETLTKKYNCDCGIYKPHEKDEQVNWRGDYTLVNNEGKEFIAIMLTNGTLIDTEILSLSKEKLNVEYSLDNEEYKVFFTKTENY